jgi:cell division protein FtsB
MVAVSEGHKTTSIRRPQPAAGKAVRARRHGSNDNSRFADFTRPIDRDKQLVRGRQRSVVWLGGLVIGVALAAAFFVLPVKSYLRQRDDIERLSAQLDVVSDANARLRVGNERLRTAEGIKEAARTEIGYVVPGEIRISLQQQPNAPLTLPSGFHFDAVAQVIAVRADAAP